MPSFNKVILAGNLVADPELRYTPKGTAVAKIRLAVNRTWKDESGAQKEEVTYVDVDAFARSAEVISQYLKKGRPILIEGRLRYEVWDDKQTNQKRSKLGVVLESFQFLDSGGTREGSGGFASAGPPDVSRQPAARPTPSRPAPSQPAPPPPSDDMPPDAEDDVPF